MMLFIILFNHCVKDAVGLLFFPSAGDEIDDLPKASQPSFHNDTLALSQRGSPIPLALGVSCRSNGFHRHWELLEE